jgi:hypothetical protein
MNQQPIKIVIPEGMDFSDLRMSLLFDGSVVFEWGVIERICEASDLPVERFRNVPDLVALFVYWYQAHLERGGAPDPIKEHLIAEAMADGVFGDGISYAPGHA